MHKISFICMITVKSTRKFGLHFSLQKMEQTSKPIHKIYSFVLRL